ncbi:MAG: integrase core domain-containing protein [Pseudomonadota bacterium]
MFLNATFPTLPCHEGPAGTPRTSFDHDRQTPGTWRCQGRCRWQANLRILDVKEIKSVPYVPLSHPFVERLIGTIRREYLDHALFWNASDLERKLEEFRQYYNSHRVHTSLGGDTPSETSGDTIIRRADLNQFRWKSHCRRLYQLPVAA